MRLLPVAALALASCGPPAERGDRVRLGYLPRLTHAPALSGVASGRYQAALGVPLEASAFDAGSGVTEALFAGDVDAAYVGPNPAINAWMRSEGAALWVVAGATEGGAALVLRPGVAARSPAELRGLRLATPHIASSADISLRAYLRRHGLSAEPPRPDVTVLPLSTPFIRSLFARGDIDGAWVAEPLAAALVVDLGGRVMVDEASEWPDGRYLTSVLVVRRAWAAAFPARAAALLDAHRAEVAWLEAHRDAGLELCTGRIRQVLGRSVPERVARAGWASLRFRAEIPPGFLETVADHARAEGFLPAGPLDGLTAPGVVVR